MVPFVVIELSCLGRSHLTQHTPKGRGKSIDPVQQQGRERQERERQRREREAGSQLGDSHQNGR